MAYTGHLVSNVAQIKALSFQGLSAHKIAETLYVGGIRPPTKSIYGPDGEVKALAATVRNILRESRGAGDAWQSWTPEMQEAEFRREYSA